MHTRRFCSILLGAWLGGMLFMFAVATQNLQSVDRVLASPHVSMSKQIQREGYQPTRLLLRHLAGEQNRYYFEAWEWVQMGFFVVLAVSLVFATNANKLLLGLTGGLFLLVLFEHWFLTPELVHLGRQIDFRPTDVMTPERARFWQFHNTYSAVEMVKLVLGLAMAAKLLFRSSSSERRRRSVREDVHAVDHAHHGHIDS